MDTANMDRETYLLGRAALKTKIKALAFEQKRSKTCLRMIRKKLSTPEQNSAALKAGGYDPTKGPTSWECLMRRMQITAYLNIYAQIRNSVPHAVPDWYYTHTYSTYLQEAQALFDRATKTAPVA